MTTRHILHTAAPGTEPGIYTSCLSSPTSHKYLAMRWWDGELWWDISLGASRGGNEFAWPDKGAARGHKRPKSYGKPYELYLRKITRQQDVHWAEPYRHFEPAEVLAWLVKTGVLREDWKTAYQNNMREQYALPREKS